MTGQQLKNSILQMAVQGKLVPQDSNDEPASVLLERIRAEKEQLIKEKKIKKEKSPSVIFRGADNLPYEKVGKNEPVCIADEVPFEIPESWEWVRLGELFQHNTGKALNSSNRSGELLTYITTSNLYWNRFEVDSLREMYFSEAEVEKCTAVKGDLLVCEGGDIGRAAIWPYNTDIRIQNHIHRLRAYVEVCTEYYYYIFFLYKHAGWIGGKGIGIKGLSSNALHSLIFPLPPLHEQQRIVTKLKMLEPFLENYTKIEKRLNNLNVQFPDLLKKSILQEAVQGKLVPQDPADEPADVLLERIRAEKERLIQEGKIKRDKHESVIYRRDNSHYEKRGSEEFCIDEELPFDLPETWSWARLGELCSVVTGRLDANAQTLDGKYAFFTCGKEIFRTDTYAFDCDAILLGGNNASGDYKMHRYSGKFNAYQRVYVISGREPDFLNYLYYVITFWLGHLKKNSQGTTTRFIKLGQVTGMLVPVPPCAEQKHIIQTIQLLLNECDHLQ